MREASALAVIRFSEVDKFEVEAEGPCELVRGGKLEAADAIERPLQMHSRRGICRPTLRRLRLSPGYRAAPQRFYSFVKCHSSLLAKNFTQQHAQRAHIAPQGSLFQFACRGLKFGKAMRPVGWRPKRRHNRLWHCPP